MMKFIPLTYQLSITGLVLSLFFTFSVYAKDSATTRVIIDASGKKVTIPVHPKRIAIASDREFTEPFVAAGFIPVAVASQHEFAPFLQEALKDAKNIIDLGHHREIDLEALATSKPDLIIIRNIKRYGSPELYEVARTIAPVVQINSMMGIRPLIKDVGNILGKDVAEKLNARIDRAVAKMAAAVNDPSKVVVSHGSVYSSELSIMQDNSNSASQLMKEAGYARPKAQMAGTHVINNDSIKISFEELGKLDGDILFLNHVGSEKDIEKMLSSNLWSTLKVVQQNAVIKSDWRSWNMGGPLAVDIIAEDFVQGLKKAGIK